MYFQSQKSFGKLRLRAFQPYYQIICMLKHVQDVEDYFDLQHCQHAGKALSLSFPKFFLIKNPLNIKEFMSKNLCVCSFPIFDVYITLQPLGVLDLSLTSLTCFHIHSI